MKKVIAVTLAIMALLASIVLLDNSIFYSVNITADTENGSVVHPGDTLEFSADCTLLGIHINKSSVLQIKTNSSQYAAEDNGSVKISNDALTGEEITVNVSYNSIIRKISRNYNYLVKYSLGSSIDDSGIISQPQRIDVLVTKNRFLPKNYAPDDLIKVNVKFLSPYNKMRAEAAGALENLFTDAKKQGYTLYGVSAYRSYNIQSRLYHKSIHTLGVKKTNLKVAKPGSSEHQTGIAIDISSKTAGMLGRNFGDTQEGKWVFQNAYKYGFIIRYPQNEEDVTGYMYEPWHLRYVGANLAKKIYESGLTFEEYMLK